MLPLDMLTPQIRHYELLQKNSRFANFSDFLTPSYAIFDFVEKIPDMLILALYLPLAMPYELCPKILDMLVLVLYYPQLCHFYKYAYFSALCTVISQRIKK